MIALHMVADLAAVLMAGAIFARALCVVYRTTPRHHRHPVLFVGFGYSYVILGAGAVFAAVELVAGTSLDGLPLWLLLIGSAGLIAFDRRAARCWSLTECPADRQEHKPLC
jgi:hypothetical protein